MRTLLSVLAVLAGLSAGPVGAQISVFHGSDGTSGTVVDLGNGFRIYSDSHGNTGTILDFGGGFQTYQFTSPQGGSQSGTITTFGSPTPPSGITPAPILPFTPHSPVMPGGQVAPVTPFAPSSAFGSSTFGSQGGGFRGR